MKKYLTGIIAALSLSAYVNAQDAVFHDDVPDAYTVVKGDTLWDISNTFLQSPWLWPEIWHVNSQIANPHLIYPGDVIRMIYIDGKPRLTLDRSGRIFKMGPKARVLESGKAIDTIPLEDIVNFLSRTRVVSAEELVSAPYVVAGLNKRLIAGAGDKVYVRGTSLEGNRSAYGVYRQGITYQDPVTKEILGVQALDIAAGEMTSVEGEIGTLSLLETNEEVRIGDKILRQESDRSIDAVFVPSSPSGFVEGVILSVEEGISTVGKNDVVSINLGERENMEVGNVLAVFKRGEQIKDRITGDKIQLPNERAGMIMIFRTFEKIAFGLVIEADQGLRVNDIVANP